MTHYAPVSPPPTSAGRREKQVVSGRVVIPDQFAAHSACILVQPSSRFQLRLQPQAEAHVVAR
eukprot:CAMPEP_0204164262 /NCGR_PEP_ID=MMETSP0361-20130328/37137_1 /ASSEMBLY_ACC=CAM_ASM_000343 /TAXON_ID=268821 /ORGANISM="Scrippsiella Hangoei, Strain SHTV-5" /LENGTH=62 /DNA_ID=CAMNT_0051121093 /DNA_START=35 /DNA_END=219 /DNA_ORIENTATION=-